MVQEQCNDMCWGSGYSVIHDCIEVQKKTGLILLPSYLEAQIVPDDIEIKLDENGGYPH